MKNKHISSYEKDKETYEKGHLYKDLERQEQYRKAAIEAHPWYEPWSDCLKREADFEVEYHYTNTHYPIYIGMQSHFKYSKEDRDVWMIFPDFLDSDGIVMMDRRVTPDLQGKAEMWILNKNNVELHRAKLSVGLTAYMTFYNNILAELKVTKVNNYDISK